MQAAVLLKSLVIAALAMADSANNFTCKYGNVDKGIFKCQVVLFT
jgi:hypothetical protein